jgi:hypothetical protein
MTMASSSPRGLAVCRNQHLERVLVSKLAAKSSQTPLNGLTRDLMPETRSILLELRSLIRTTIPGVTEKANLGRKSLNFSHPNVGYFCGLRPVDDRVTVEFEFGVLLPDPDGVLDARSCAKQVRYARIHSPNDLPRAAFKRLLNAAVSLPRERSTRIALVRSGAKLVLPKPRARKRTRSS